MAYDQNLVVNCIKRHYKLLLKAAYFDPAEVLYPPDEGWSDEQLAVDILRAFGRSEAVIDLLRHLPYVKQSDGDDRDEVWFETRHLSYLRDTRPCKSLTAEDCRGRNLAEKLMMPGPENWPAGFISLTCGPFATWWIIDTAKGILHAVGQGYKDPPEDEPWLVGSTPRNIHEYFDEIYHNIEYLRYIPCPLKRGLDGNRTVEPYTWDVGKVVSQALQKHGWPSNLNRAGYLRELKEILQED